MSFHQRRPHDARDQIDAAASLIALVVVARKLGLHLDARQMMREHRLERGEVSPNQLIRLAGSAGLRATGLRPGWNELGRLAKALPAIVYLQDGGAMVLIRVERLGGAQRVIVQEPSAEDALLSLDCRQFSAIWSGELVLVQRSHSMADVVQPFSLRLIAALIMFDRKMVRDVAIAALMLSLLALSPILFWRLLSQRVIPYHAFNTFLVVCLVMIVLIGFETAFSVLRRILLLRLTTRVDVKLTTDMFSRVLALPVDYFERPRPA